MPEQTPTRQTIKDTAEMIAAMTPTRDPGLYVFATSQGPTDEIMSAARARYEEAEGTSLILPLEVAQAAGFDTSFPMACLTLQVHSALDGTGLTAAVAGALARAGIACNMVAAFHHDHAYVPADRAEEALAVLLALAARGADG